MAALVAALLVQADIGHCVGCVALRRPLTASAHMLTHMTAICSQQRTSWGEGLRQEHQLVAAAAAAGLRRCVRQTSHRQRAVEQGRDEGNEAQEGEEKAADGVGEAVGEEGEEAVGMTAEAEGTRR